MDKWIDSEGHVWYGELETDEVDTELAKRLFENDRPMVPGCPGTNLGDDNG